jgi:hypothetical protein
MKTKAEQLEWRRSKVIEMRDKGMGQIEIVREQVLALYQM